LNTKNQYINVRHKIQTVLIKVAKYDKTISTNSPQLFCWPLPQLTTQISILHLQLERSETNHFMLQSLRNDYSYFISIQTVNSEFLHILHAFALRLENTAFKSCLTIRISFANSSFCFANLSCSTWSSASRSRVTSTSTFFFIL